MDIENYNVKDRKKKSKKDKKSKDKRSKKSRREARDESDEEAEGVTQVEMTNSNTKVNNQMAAPDFQDSNDES